MSTGDPFCACGCGGWLGQCRAPAVLASAWKAPAVLPISPAPALSPEERAERAWEERYPIDDALYRLDKDGFVAGYLAALKEKQ